MAGLENFVFWLLIMKRMPVKKVFSKTLMRTPYVQLATHLQNNNQLLE